MWNAEKRIKPMSPNKQSNYKTPAGAETNEKTRTDDEAVKDAVTAEDDKKSVLPGPPIPPSVQRKLRESSQDS
jgi:hypothetical protein